MCGFTVIAQLGGEINVTFPHNGHFISVDDALKPNGTTNGVKSSNSVNGDHAKSIITEARLLESLKQIDSRGPDSKGTWINSSNTIGLGHCRLSINDLSPAGSQPFHDASNRIHAVVNGELYDYDRLHDLCVKEGGYKFQGHSDSELAIALYELYGSPNFLQHLRGEFAVIIYDENTGELISAIDRFGIKPLFWTVIDNGPQGKHLVLASEAKAFLPLGWKPEWAVENIANNGMFRDTRTVFKNVFKVQPGFAFKFGREGMTRHQYWDIKYNDKNKKETRTVNDMVLQVREKLVDAIRARLRSDVPVGIYLSGGLDSSAIAGILAHIMDEGDGVWSNRGGRKNLMSFTIAFDQESGFDESDIAARTADHLGIPIKRCHMDEQRLADNFEDATWHNEVHCPDLGTVGKFCLSQTVRENNYKVVMTGEGSDEIFAGYPWFLIDLLQETDASLPDLALSQQPRIREAKHQEVMRDFVATFDRMIGGNWKPDVQKKLSKQLDDVYGATVCAMFAQPINVIKPDIALKLGGIDNGYQAIIDSLEPEAREALSSGKWHALHVALYIWCKGQLADGLLVCLGDRVELAHSVEGRTPFLDHHLVELVNSLPPSVKIHYGPDAKGPAYDGPWWSNEEDAGAAHFWEKWILREAAKPFITEELFNRRKHMYTAPATWPVGGVLWKRLTGLVNKENVEELGFVDWEAMRTILDRAFGERASNEAFRAVLNVAGWVVISKRFGVARADY